MQHNCIIKVSLQRNIPMIPELAGVHHLKLPVSDLGRSRAWYESRLGYVTYLEFKEGGALMGIAMRHPEGGPDLALRLAPEKAAAAAGFDYFSIGVPDRERIERLAEHLTELGEEHAGVHATRSAGSCPCCMTPTATRFASTRRTRIASYRPTVRSS
jgi:catechol 2,3-dioxygenase-like lactoylglutathione lyase family enzyme